MSWRTRVGTVVVTSSLFVAGLGTLGRPAIGAQRVERHPHIRAAIRELRESKRELETAAHDFGGHRVRAVRACDHAIEQLELSLRFDRN